MYMEQILNSVEKLCHLQYYVHNTKIGLIFGRKTEISNIVVKKCVLGNFPSIKLIALAQEKKARLIIVKNSFFADERDIKEIFFQKMRILTEANIWVYCLGNSWDYVNGGMLETTAEALDFKILGNYYEKDELGIEYKVGRVIKPQTECYISNFLIKLSTLINKKVIRYLGDPEAIIGKTLIILSPNDDRSFINFLLVNQIKTLIISSKSTHLFPIFYELHINAIEIAHDEMVCFGISKLRNLLMIKHPNVEFILHEDQHYQEYINENAINN